MVHAYIRITLGKCDSWSASVHFILKFIYKYWAGIIDNIVTS